MTFANLSISTQNLVMLQNEQTMKYLFFFVSIALCSYYLFVYKKNHETVTPFFSLGLARSFVTVFSWVWLVATPFQFLLMNPSVSFNQFYVPLLWIYSVFSLLAIAVIGLDFMYYVPQILVEWMGIDSDNKKVKQVKSWLRRMGKK